MLQDLHAVQPGNFAMFTKANVEADDTIALFH